MKDTFKWNRETINEFFDSFPDDDLVTLVQRMEQFKSSKAPKKEWEIVAFRENQNNMLYLLKDDGLYYAEDLGNKAPGYDFARMIAYGDKIHSVRRLSDQAVFTKSEVVGTPNDGQHHIGGFEVIGNFLYALFSGGQISIEHLQKLPQPILTTVDGVEIFPRR